MPPKITLVHLSFPFLVDTQYLAVQFSDVPANSQTIFKINVLLGFGYFSFCSFLGLGNGKRLQKQPKLILEAEICLPFFFSPVPQYCFLHFIASELMSNMIFSGHALGFQDFLGTFFLHHGSQNPFTAR